MTQRTQRPSGPGLRGLLPALSEQLPQVIDEVVALLRTEWPDYAQVLVDDPEVADLAATALRHLLTLAERVPEQRSLAVVDGPSSAADAVFEELGRAEWRDGRALGTLLSAYRAGARVAWRHLSRAAVEQSVPPEELTVLAEAVFVFVEELSSASARGYLDEQRASSAERDRSRAALVDLLLSERSTAAAVEATAARAGWRVPASVALVAVDETHAGAGDLVSRLDAAALEVRGSELVGAIVADPDAPGARDRLRRQLAGCGAVVSPPVTPQLLPATVRVVTVASRLRRSGVLSGDPVFVADHVDAVVVHQDPRLLASLSSTVLAPLAGEPNTSRDRLEQTLAAWLAAMGDRQAVAQSLHIHPQTVSYRLNRLRQLFGTRLDDPQERLKLTLALCWRRPEGDA